MMSKADFEAVAEVLAEHKDSEETYYIAMDLSDVFYSRNPRFSHDKFFNAIDFDGVSHIFEETK